MTGLHSTPVIRAITGVLESGHRNDWLATATILVESEFPILCPQPGLIAVH